MLHAVEGSRLNGHPESLSGRMLASSNTPYAALPPDQPPPPRHHGVGGVGFGLFAGVGLTLAALGGASVLRVSATPQAAAPMTLDAHQPMMKLDAQQPSIGGDCQCSASAGAVCCCCSHCGCGGEAPPQAQRRGNDTEGERGGNWDIDVGAPGVAGGGFCQCNGQCCCCSSCDCTGPGSSVVNSTVSVSGDCNSVGGGASCNGDLPARRRLADDASAQRLSERVRRDARLRLLGHVAA